MPRLRDYSGIDNTCPKINKVISFIEECMSCEGIDTHEASLCIQLMEAIRKDNESLRLFGNQLYAEKESLESDVNHLVKENARLNYDVEHYSKQLKELESQLIND